MHILGVHTGSHDASACLFSDFELVAAVSQERLTRVKNSGVSLAAPMPDAAIDEVLAIGGIAREQVDVVAISRALFDPQDFRLTGIAALEEAWRRARKERGLRLLDRMMRKSGTTDAASIFRAEDFLSRHRFSGARLHFYNHHLAHALSAYFYSQFDSALIHTADGWATGSPTARGSPDARGSNCCLGATKVCSAPSRSIAWACSTAGLPKRSALSRTGTRASSSDSPHGGARWRSTESCALSGSATMGVFAPIFAKTVVLAISPPSCAATSPPQTPPPRCRKASSF